jgi:hypothetical protein
VTVGFWALPAHGWRRVLVLAGELVSGECQECSTECAASRQQGPTQQQRTTASRDPVAAASRLRQQKRASAGKRTMIRHFFLPLCSVLLPLQPLLLDQETRNGRWHRRPAAAPGADEMQLQQRRSRGRRLQ